MSKTLFRTQYALPLANHDEEINVDLFAGGGGASTGLEMGLGRPVHIAVNHNPAAISMHEANHPGTLHLQTDVWEVDPVQVLAGRRVGWFHGSPDCTHHSQAIGGQPRKKEIRDLSWVIMKWAGIAQPRIISLENVKQIRSWGPLVAKRCKQTGRVITLDRIKCPATGKTINRVAERGEQVPRHNQFLVPCPRRRGSTWRRFLRQLEQLGYAVEHRILRACDYGAPTTRERLFLVARRDGQPIIWPEPTHAAKPCKGQQKWRTAAECIDWSIPIQSIFERKRPLADATLRRIAKGIQREVIDNARPFIVSIANWSQETVHPIDRPLNTITAQPKGGAFALATPVMVSAAHGEGRPGGVQRWGRGSKSADEPLGTITASGSGGHSLATAFLAQMNGGYNTTHSNPLGNPVSTITNTGSQQQLVIASLAHLRVSRDARDVSEPLRTISAGGQRHGLITALAESALTPEIEDRALRCAAFMVNYYGNGDARSVEQPLDTITTRDRLALITVWIGGQPWVIVDICLRMLQPHELYAAQGFPANYIITHGHDGRRFTKSEQVHMCGNSVSPPPMAAIAAANNPWRADQVERREAA